GFVVTHFCAGVCACFGRRNFRSLIRSEIVTLGRFFRANFVCRRLLSAAFRGRRCFFRSHGGSLRIFRSGARRVRCRRGSRSTAATFAVLALGRLCLTFAQLRQRVLHLLHPTIQLRLQNFFRVIDQR